MKGGGIGAISRDLDTLFGAGALGGLSDGYLLDRFVERREAAAFEVLVHRHGPMVWAVCRRVLRDSHDAEDAFQVTFLVLARRAASVMPREKLGNWLYGVAYQTARKARAKRSKRQGRESQVPDMPEPKAVSDASRDDLLEYLDRELSRLPEKYRSPVVMCDLEGMSHRQAASQLGWPVGTVSSRLLKARAMLARRLSRPGLLPSGGFLAVLIAQDVASASMPTQLVYSTARAASLFAAGQAVTVGLVSAEVIVITREVMRIMTMIKFTVIVAAVAGLTVITGLGTGATNLIGEQSPAAKSEIVRTSDKPGGGEPAESSDPLAELMNIIDIKAEGNIETVREKIARTREMGFKIAKLQGELDRLAGENAPAEKQVEMRRRLEAYKLVREGEREETDKLLEDWIFMFTQAKAALQKEKGQSR
jgi:RNA polymerase sigma factor (sigma-70 family)